MTERKTGPEPGGGKLGAQGDTFKEALTLGLVQGQDQPAPRSKCLLKCQALGTLLASNKLHTEKGEDRERERKEKHRRKKETKRRRQTPEKHKETWTEASGTNRRSGQTESTHGEGNYLDPVLPIPAPREA